MNDEQKTAAKAVAIPHKIPSKHEVDTLGDELANLEMKLSKIRRKAILSAGEARRDQAELDEIQKLTDEKSDAFRLMVDNYTLPPKAVDVPVALEAVREKMAAATADPTVRPDMLVAAHSGVTPPRWNPQVWTGDMWAVMGRDVTVEYTADGPIFHEVEILRTTLPKEIEAQDPEAAKAVEAIGAALEKTPATGGKVSLGVAYLVGEKGAETIVPRGSPIAIAVEAGTFRAREGDKVESAHGYVDMIREKTAAIDAATASLKKANETPLPEVEAAIEAPSPESINADRWRKAHAGAMPPDGVANEGDLWIYRRPLEVDRFLTFLGGDWREFDNDREEWLPVMASDLERDFWKRGDLERAMKANRPKRSLFSAKA